MEGAQVMERTQSLSDGAFILKGVNPGNYTLVCTHMGYTDYIAEVQVNKEASLSLGTLIMSPQSVQLKEATVSISRNVLQQTSKLSFPQSNKQRPREGGLDLLQKLPIPLLDINPFYRTISSLDPSGGVAILINDIPADANEVAVLDPKQIRYVEVVRKPGMRYGDQLAMAINIVLKQARNGISLGMNTTNSILLKRGNNNIFATYIRGKSQFSVNQNEDYQNYSHQESEELRQYLLPNNSWHKIEQQSLLTRTLSATHGTTVKYNFTQPNNFVFQVQGYITSYRTPKLEKSFLVRETGKNDYIYHTHNRDEYNSTALNLYFKKYLPNEQMLMFNAVGTSIKSDYDYRYNQEDNDFQTSYGVEGKKIICYWRSEIQQRFRMGKFDFLVYVPSMSTQTTTIRVAHLTKER